MWPAGRRQRPPLRVRRELPPFVVGRAHDVQQRIGREIDDAAVGRIVDTEELRAERSIGLAHVCGTGVHAAIEPYLEAAPLEPFVTLAGGPRRFRNLFETQPRGHDDPDRQVILLLQNAVERKGFRAGATIANRRQPRCGISLEHLLECVELLLLAERSLSRRIPDEAARSADENPVRFTFGVLHDAAALRIGRALVMPLAFNTYELTADA